MKLEQGRLRMLREIADNGRAHMVRWYTDRAQQWFARGVERYRRRVGGQPAVVVVRDLGYRWGSCGKGGKLFFHWRSILLPPRVVEYVVVHELYAFGEPRR